MDKQERAVIAAVTSGMSDDYLSGYADGIRHTLEEAGRDLLLSAKSLRLLDEFISERERSFA